MEDTVVIATTRSVTGNGHGLIVQFDTTNAGALPAFSSGSPLTNNTTGVSGNNFRIINGGEGYADGDWLNLMVGLVAALRFPSTD